MINTVVLFGGRSSEYEVSLSSAFAVFSNIDYTKFNVTKIGITKEGKWYLFDGDIALLPENKWYSDSLKEVSINMSTGKLTVEGNEIPCDVILPIMHGACGEDGTMQGLFSVINVPIVGCQCASSAVCMDKAITKAVVNNETHIRQAKAVVAKKSMTKSIAELKAKCESEIGYPMFVKPACAGSSVGASKVKNADSFDKAIEVAFNEGDKILIEECIVGREIEVAVLEEHGEYTVSYPAEIDIGSSDFYDYETKYISDASSFYIPARLDDETTEQVRKNALRIFKALDCKSFSRVDFFCTADNTLIFNEINTIPGFTPISMYPKLMNHSGISYTELVERLIMSALD